MGAAVSSKTDSEAALERAPEHVRAALELARAEGAELHQAHDSPFGSGESWLARYPQPLRASEGTAVALSLAGFRRWRIGEAYEL